MRRHLCIGAVGKAVPYYRMMAPPWGQQLVMGGEALAFLEEHGLSWDLVHTNLWTDEGRAIAAMLREQGAQIVADIDDWVEGVPAGSQAYSAWTGENRLRYRKLMEEADRRTASTPFLADRYGAKVAPNFIDPALWDWPARATRSDEECVLLVPAGSGRAGDYLEIGKAVRAFLELPHTKAVFMNWMPDYAQQYPAGKVVWCRWVPFEDYRRMVRWIAPDMIVSPMEHHDFNLAKSNLKWLEAGAVGACFVGERWGEYERTVRDGVTGVLASGAEEWTEALVSLALDSGRRSGIAAAGQTAVYSGWTWQAVEGQWRAAVLGEEG